MTERSDLFRLGPRLVVAGTHSGSGKTTVATGLMAALRRRGLAVAAAKVGPDFIDPGYHALATGRPGRNLDAWICGESAIGPLAGRASAGADVLIVEGVMGMFDGASDPVGTGSTAHVTRLLDAPVVLVIDASSVSRSVAAMVHGFATYEPDVRVAGVLLNRVGSDGHEVLLREALLPLGIPVLGALRRDDAFAWRDRHLGLVPVVEHRARVERSLDALATAMEAYVDLDGLVATAGRASRVPVPALPPPTPSGRVRLAVAGGPAFSFVYPDNLEAFEAAGAELVPFDPRVDARLPEAEGLYVGGGFPEVFVEELAANEPLLADVRRRVREGMATLAECGGLLWLARALDGRQMAGVVQAEARMTDQLTLGYREARVRTETPVAPAGGVLRGHEFHYSTLEPAGEMLEMRGRFGNGFAGHGGPRLLASYLHLHFGGDPTPAERLVATAAAPPSV